MTKKARITTQGKMKKEKQKDENQERTAHANRDREAYEYLSILLGDFTVILV
jgi:hypothetical protein